MLSTASKQRESLGLQNLKPEQVKAINRLYEQDETLLIAKVGFGKAIVALTAAAELLQDKVLKRIIVFAPLRVCTMTWREEARDWSHIPDTVAIACGTEAERTAAFRSPARIVVTNFENMTWAVKKFGSKFDGMIIDEITKMKTPGGAKMTLMRHWVRGLKWRVGMTGTPVSEAGTDIYAQALLLDCGKALGTRFDGFKRKYFYPVDYEQRRWELLPGKEIELSVDLAPLVFIADDHEYWANLPPVRDHFVQCPLILCSESHRLYTQMERDGVCVTSSGLQVVAESAAVQKNKLCQLASGGLYSNDGALAFMNPHKLDTLRILLYDFRQQGRTAVVVYQYTFELDALRKMYPKAPVLGGGNKVPADLIDRWSAGEIPVLLMHPKSAAHGLNLQYGGFTLIHLAPIWGSDPWQQVLGRLQRRGQPNAWIDRYVLLTPGTVDEEMLARLDEKKSREALLMGALG